MEYAEPNPNEARASLVQQWIKRVQEAKKHWQPDFDRMRRNMAFASGKQWDNNVVLLPGERDTRYKVNIVQRMLKTAVSSIYATNPTVMARRRQTLDFRVWDGRPESIQMAMQEMQIGMQTGVPPSPQTMMLLQDIEEGKARRMMLDKMGKTMEILARHYMNEQKPSFKMQMKQMVRRARTTGVAYVKPGFQRAMQLSPDQKNKIDDMATRLAVIGRLQADIDSGQTDPMAAEAEELRLAIQAIESEPEMIIREGLIFSFPLSTKIIPSTDTQKLMGWIGTSWIAEEYVLSCDQVKETYGVDLKKGDYSSYSPIAGQPFSAAKKQSGKDGGGNLACLWHIYDRTTGLEYVVADGYKDFLKEPSSPSVMTDDFFAIEAITFNEIEDEARVFPDSDVENVTNIQMEYNRSKEGLRQHRIANRPLYVAAKGTFDDEERHDLANHRAHEVVLVNAMHDTTPDKLIVPVSKVGVDPNLYETEGVFRDMLRTTGFQEANFGGVAGGTATETTVASNSLTGVVNLDKDDLDDMLSRVMRTAGQIMLTELSLDTVQRIAGPGAVWPELSRQEVMEELFLDVRAGSTGRPDQAQDAAAFERMYPVLLQIPGISPSWLGRKAASLADQFVDLEEAFIEGLPSVIAMNRMAQVGTGDPASEPSEQGGEGGDNGERDLNRAAANQDATFPV